MAIPAACLAVAGQLALSGTASATHTVASVKAATSSKLNLLDCNATFFEKLCTDPHGKPDEGYLSRFRDPITGAYVGHDEPSVKFISSRAGSGNTMTYGMRLSTDPAKAPTASGSVTHYGELSVAPWFGLPMCDPNSYPQNPCTPLSDSNTGLDTPTDAGSAFMELQFYAPGFAPFIDSTSCSRTQWCAALTIDSLECNFNFATCNNDCIEPVNFAFLQTNGVPAGPPSPQDTNVSTLFGNGHTLKMNPGDWLTVSISDVPSSGSPDRGGMKAVVRDLTTGQTGFMVASAANGFQNTSITDCSGTPFSFHAEYSSARQQNQVPWAALEGGVLCSRRSGTARHARPSATSSASRPASPTAPPTTTRRSSRHATAARRARTRPARAPATRTRASARTPPLKGQPVRSPARPTTPAAGRCVSSPTPTASRRDPARSRSAE